MTEHTRPKLDTIQVMRFIAASAVVAVHLPRIGHGHWGVDLFFIISGFIMMLSTEKSTQHFFLKRIIRVVPSYWLLTFAMFAVGLALPSLLNNTTANPIHLLKSLFFIPFDKNGAGHLPILFVGWTLNFEMYFYLLFAIALAVSHKYRAIVASGMIVTCYLLVNSLQVDYPFAVYGDSITLEFLLGMLSYYLLIRPANWQKHAAILGGLAIIPLIIGGKEAAESRGYMLGLPCFVIFVLGNHLLKNIKYPHILVLLGESSYALYLLHAYIILLISKTTNLYWADPITASITTAISYLLCLVASVVFLKLFENPAGKYLRKLLLPSKTS